MAQATAQNQRTIISNQRAILTNQTKILRNQKGILTNQKKILKNQARFSRSKRRRRFSRSHELSMKPLLWSSIASLVLATTLPADRTIAERLGHPANSSS
jgi:hypothetical protein